MLQIIDIFRGAAHGGWSPTELPGMRIYSLVIATHALHATGYAMGIGLDGTWDVVPVPYDWRLGIDTAAEAGAGAVNTARLPHPFGTPLD